MYSIFYLRFFQLQEFVQNLTEEEIRKSLLGLFERGGTTIATVRSILSENSLAEENAITDIQPWCRCAHCHEQEKPKERKSCKMSSCVTTDPTFAAICLNRHVLEAIARRTLDWAGEDQPVELGANLLRKAGYRQYISVLAVQLLGEGESQGGPFMCRLVDMLGFSIEWWEVYGPREWLMRMVVLCIVKLIISLFVFLLILLFFSVRFHSNMLKLFLLRIKHGCILWFEWTKNRTTPSKTQLIRDGTEPIAWITLNRQKVSANDTWCIQSLLLLGKKIEENFSQGM